MNIISKRIYKETGKYVSRCDITDRRDIGLINNLIGGIYSKNLMKDVIDIWIFGDRFNKQDKSVVESVLRYGGTSGVINGSLVSWTEEGIETQPGTNVTFDNYTYETPSCLALIKPTGPYPQASSSQDQFIVWTRTHASNWLYRYFRYGSGDTGSVNNAIPQVYSKGATSYRHYGLSTNYGLSDGLFCFMGADFSPTTITDSKTFFLNSALNQEATTEVSTSQSGFFEMIFTSNAGDAQGKFTFFITFKNTRETESHWPFLRGLVKDTVGRDLTGITV